MTTKRQIRDSIAEATSALAALDGALEASGVDSPLRSYCADIAACLELCLQMTPEMAPVVGVPKIELPLDEWLEIERIAGVKERSPDPRRRAREVVGCLERQQQKHADLRGQMARLTGGVGM